MCPWAHADFVKFAAYPERLDAMDATALRNPADGLYRRMAGLDRCFVYYYFNSCLRTYYMG